jgi:hypothetical protein
MFALKRRLATEESPTEVPILAAKTSGVYARLPWCFYGISLTMT